MLACLSCPQFQIGPKTWLLICLETFSNWDSWQLLWDCALFREKMQAAGNSVFSGLINWQNYLKFPLVHSQGLYTSGVYECGHIRPIYHSSSISSVKMTFQRSSNLTLRHLWENMEGIFYVWLTNLETNVKLSSKLSLEYLIMDLFSHFHHEMSKYPNKCETHSYISYDICHNYISLETTDSWFLILFNLYLSCYCSHLGNRTM